MFHPVIDRAEEAVVDGLWVLELVSQQQAQELTNLRVKLNELLMKQLNCPPEVLQGITTCICNIGFGLVLRVARFLVFIVWKILVLVSAKSPECKPSTLQ